MRILFRIVSLIPLGLLCFSGAVIANPKDESCTDTSGKKVACQLPKQPIKSQKSLPAAAAKKNSPALTPPSANPPVPSSPPDSNASIKKALLEMVSLRLEKGDFETTTEFRARVDKLISEIDGKSYQMSIPLVQSRLVSFDADTSRLTILMPDPVGSVVYVQGGEKLQVLYPYYSFIRVVPERVKESTYTARNGLGNETVVTKLESTSIGIGILAVNKEKSVRQVYSTHIGRELAKELFENGSVLLDVRADLRWLGPNSFLSSGRSRTTASPLFIRNKEIKPTMSEPMHAILEHIVLPVKLLSVSLMDHQGKEIFKAHGTEIGPIE